MANQIILDTGDNAEEAKYVVCIRVTVPLKFDDNLISECCECGCEVQHRPHGPKTPPKICWECAMPGMVKAQKENDLGIIITEQTKREVMEYLKKRGH